MKWKFWKPRVPDQPPAPSEPVSGWRAVRAKVFSKEYSGTRWMLIFTIAQYFLIAPVQPWIPDKSELHELVGMPKFQHYLTSSESGIHFKVDGVLLHCSFSGTGGLNGCDHYEDLILKGKPVRATYFWMTANRWTTAKVLNSVEQDEHMVVSAADTYRRRLISFNAGKETTLFLNLLFSSIVILLWFLERSKSKRNSTNAHQGVIAMSTAPTVKPK